MLGIGNTVRNGQRIRAQRFQGFISTERPALVPEHDRSDDFVERMRQLRIQAESYRKPSPADGRQQEDSTATLPEALRMLLGEVTRQLPNQDNLVRGLQDIRHHCSIDHAALGQEMRQQFETLSETIRIQLRAASAADWDEVHTVLSAVHDRLDGLARQHDENQPLLESVGAALEENNELLQENNDLLVDMNETREALAVGLERLSTGRSSQMWSDVWPDGGLGEVAEGQQKETEDGESFRPGSAAGDDVPVEGAAAACLHLQDSVRLFASHMEEEHSAWRTEPQGGRERSLARDGQARPEAEDEGIPGVRGNEVVGENDGQAGVHASNPGTGKEADDDHDAWVAKVIASKRGSRGF